MGIKIKKVALGCYILFAKNLPNNSCSKKIRAFWARLACEHVGKNVNIRKNALFCRRLKIGDESGIGEDSEIWGDVTIGSNVMMGPDVIFYTSNHKFDRTDIPMCKQGFNEEKPIIIGDDVWIGRRVMFMPGVHVGNGVVIGAGTIVTKDIPNYAVVVGNPARIIKFRNL